MFRHPKRFASMVLTGSLCFAAASAAADQKPPVRALTQSHAPWTRGSQPSRVRQDSDHVLYAFKGSPSSGVDGAYPYGGLFADKSGALYGTTFHGGSAGGGIVFKLIPSGSGNYTEDVIYAFEGGSDGSLPYANPVGGKLGVLYGTTARGGMYGHGTVYALTPAPRGRRRVYSESVLYSFHGGSDGASPEGALYLDKRTGTLYGTSYYGGGSSSSSGGDCGSSGCGTVFSLTRTGSGGYTESVIHAFAGSDGANPSAGLIRGKGGMLFGTTVHGGRGVPGFGTVFALNPHEGYLESVLYIFQGTDGGDPYSTLISDASGALYGTTVMGGAYNSGSVFKLTPTGSGSYTPRILYTFEGCGFSSPSCDGADPYAGVIADASGNLYGTTNSGSAAGKGTVFELARSSSGDSYTESLLYSFQGGSDGSGPEDALILVSGALYGTTFYGGSGYGTVFSLSP